MTMMQQQQLTTGLWNIFWDQTSGTQTNGTHIST